MHGLYILRPPSKPASPPARWSYSALAAWRECPRRWWLLHSSYLNAPTGTYPVPYGPSALQGRLVHAALEAYAQFRRRHTSATPHAAGERFNARLFLKRALRDVLAAESATNPRLDVSRLQAGVSLDACLSLFYAITEQMPFAPSPPRPTGLPPVAGCPPSDAEEVWVEVDDPRLVGRIDRAQDGCLTDFKTGEASASHAEQLVFYAVLWWLKFGEPPRGLRLVYPETGVSHDVSVPPAAELAAIAESYRAEVADATIAIQGGRPEARLGVAACERCPVRQLCDEYWTDGATLPLRSPGTDADGTVVYRDIRLNLLPDTWRPSQPLRGPAQADLLGAVTASIDGSNCPNDQGALPVAARLLGACVARVEARWDVRASSTCEVFWEVAGEAAP